MHSQVTGKEEDLQKAKAQILRNCADARRALTVLINNAGVQEVAAVETATIANARKVFEVNFFGLLRTTQLFVPEIRSGVHKLKEIIKSRGGNNVDFSGRVVNIGSVAGFVTLPFYGLYAGTKKAVEAVNDALRLELHSDDIEVSLIQPGAVLTSIEAKMDIQIERQIEVSKSLDFENDYHIRLKKMSDSMAFMMNTPTKQVRKRSQRSGAERGFAA